MKIASVKQMADRTIGNQYTIFHLERTGILIGSPASKILAIKEFGPFRLFVLA
jgi:hypothetical protein